jgi:hypothetical protein
LAQGKFPKGRAEATALSPFNGKREHAMVMRSSDELENQRRSPGIQLLMLSGLACLTANASAQSPGRKAVTTVGGGAVHSPANEAQNELAQTGAQPPAAAGRPAGAQTAASTSAVASGTSLGATTVAVNRLGGVRSALTTATSSASIAAAANTAAAQQQRQHVRVHH